MVTPQRSVFRGERRYIAFLLALSTDILFEPHKFVEQLLGPCKLWHAGQQYSALCVQFTDSHDFVIFTLMLQQGSLCRMVWSAITRIKWHEIITINDLTNESFNVKACWLNISTDLLINQKIQGTTSYKNLRASAPKHQQQWLKPYFILYWWKWRNKIYWCHESIISIHSSNT